MLVVPALAVAALVLLPIFYLVRRALQADTGVVALLTSERTRLVLQNTVVLAVLVAVTAAVLAVPLAWLVNRTDLPLRRLWATVGALPLVIPSYVGAIAFAAVLGPRGYLYDGIDRIVSIGPLPSIYGLFGAWLTLSLFTMPYVFLTVSAAIAGLDPGLEEAARGMGDGPWRAFWRCTLPQLRPAILAGMVLSALYAISDFGVVTLLRYDSLTRAIYVQYRSSFDRTYAAALALLLIGLAIGLLIVESLLRGRSAYYRLGSGARRSDRIILLGRWRYPALGFVGLLVAFSFVLPIAVLTGWLIRAVRRGDPFDSFWLPAWHSASLSAAAALLTTLAAIPVILLAIRYGSRIGRLTERLTFLGYGLPGIAVALAFVFIGANYLPGLYQTLPLLLIACLVRFIPQATGALRGSVAQISPRLDDAARGLGRSAPRVAWDITLPLARPGVTMSLILVFLTVLKELPMTLLLGPTGYQTLATQIWTDAGSGAYGRAAAPALGLIALAAVPAAIVLSRRPGPVARAEAS